MNIASFQIALITLPRVRGCLSFKQLRKHSQHMALSLFLSLFAIEIAHSDGVPQNWVPEAIVLPDDAAVTMDRKVGSSIRMFAFSTGVDVETLFTGWPTALEKSGYDIRPQQPDLGATMIEFSGLGILNAKISVGAATGGNRVVITFDATLE